MDNHVDIPLKLSELNSFIGDIINEHISNADYDASPLIAYVNDSLAILCDYLDFVANNFKKI